jgi:bacillithiol biosynthesis cysteine-adding enzyme BshC
MPNDCISYQESGYFSPLVNDYLNRKPELQPFFHRFPNIENFAPQIVEKQSNFNGNRQVLTARLKAQYSGLDVSLQTQENIRLLRHQTTFTVTTGHQLNLFTGPLYFLYKIVSAINLCRTLKQEYPHFDFVPVYWMAAEDHDFDEINHFYFKGQKFSWHHETAGPVGRISTESLRDFYPVFAKAMGNSHNAAQLAKWFEEAYLQQTTVTQATRSLVNAIFGHYGLVIVDGDDRELKRAFIPYIKTELIKQKAFAEVGTAIEHLGYDAQVNPREINLFYIEDGLRERIVYHESRFRVNHTEKYFSRDEILKLVDKSPERFSPNVIMRPLYQEVILPNLCYIGGGGELAYWLELKSFFDSQGVTFPILLLRNSVLLATEKQAKKADKLGLSWRDLFMKSPALANVKVRGFSAFDLDFTPLRQTLRKQFDYLADIARQTDGSFEGAVKAQETKQLKGLDNLEKRLLKAEKKHHADALKRIADLQYQLFPGGSLQERTANFAEFYLEYGQQLIEKLLAELHPLDHEFKVVTL